MDRLVVCVFTVSPYLTTAFGDGRTPFEYLMDRIDRILENESIAAEPLVVSAGLTVDDRERLGRLKIPESWQRLEVPENSAAAVYRAIETATEAETEQLIVIRLDAPLIDTTIASELLDLQKRSWCDYTFADGYPTGHTPEILRRDLLSVLTALAEQNQEPWRAGVIFETLQRDINAFDIETIAAPEDYATVRASLTVDARQNYLLCRGVVERAESAEEQRALLLAEPITRRTLPYYYTVQITTEMVQTPVYTPWNETRWRPDPPGTGSAMSIDLWNDLIGEIAQETPEAIIAVGYRGEPSCHPELPALIDTVGEYPGLQVYIETSGIGWSDAAAAALTASPVRAVIVELDTDNRHTYEALRGRGMGEAVQFVERLAAKIPGRVYVQATRIRENEWELQDFYRHWNGVDGVSVIIQKHNSFAGRIDDRKVADLSPLHRMACRHLERDMVILVDGTVPRCMQDLDNEVKRGVFPDRSLRELWRGGSEEFVGHTQAAYPEMCKGCDEYYTFNA